MLDEKFTTFDPPLDPGIEKAVLVLQEAGIETFESCQGGEGHAYPAPAIRFNGARPEGFKALAAALYAGLNVRRINRTWGILDGEPDGPYWEIVFWD